MIDQTNCETWFFMYADNELSADERLLVEEFVQNNSDYKKQFDLVQQIKFQPEHIAFPDTSFLLAEQMLLNDLKFEADMSITYPSKKALYRQTSHRERRAYFPMSIAASLLLLVGLFFLFNQEEKAPSALLVTNNIVQDSISVPPSPLVSNDVKSNAAKPIRMASSVSLNKIPLAAQKELALQKEESPIVPEIESQTEETIVIASTPSSNFSEEVLKAAASRMVLSSPSEQDAVAINTAMIIEASAKTKEQGRLRGLVRKLSRQIFKDKETDNQEKYIQVASFAIPVSNKK